MLHVGVDSKYTLFLFWQLAAQSLQVNVPTFTFHMYVYLYFNGIKAKNK